LDSEIQGVRKFLGFPMIKDRVLSHRLDAVTKTRISTLIIGGRYPSMSEFIRRAINELMTREDEQRNRWWSRN
jgi:Arc/MetJ-type ribon-helix-helix transcriptional regulator